MQPLLKVLLGEKNEEMASVLIEAIHYLYPSRFEIDWIKSVEEGRGRIKLVDTYAVMAFGYYLYGGDSITIVREMHQRTTRPIVANSSDMVLRGELLAAGCTHNCRGKHLFPDLLGTLV